jgi:hypothetical protein
MVSITSLISLKFIFKVTYYYFTGMNVPYVVVTFSKLYAYTYKTFIFFQKLGEHVIFFEIGTGFTLSVWVTLTLSEWD